MSCCRTFWTTFSSTLRSEAPTLYSCLLLPPHVQIGRMPLHMPHVADTPRSSACSPLNVMTQDMTRTFLARCEPKEFFTFYAKGTLVEDMTVRGRGPARAWAPRPSTQLEQSA